MNRKKITKKIWIILFTAGLSGLSQNAFSQQNDKDEQIEEVIVSVNRTEQNINETGRSATLITSEEIEHSVSSNVSELLAFKEGINIIGIGQNPGSLQSIYLRGAGINQTVIMIDGVRMNDPSTVNNSIDLSELSLSNIERIEIVRGSHSTLFGSSAIGGVINIITKKKKQNGFHTSTEIIAGTFGKSTYVLSENIDMNYTTKTGVYANVGFFNTNVNGLDATIDTIPDLNNLHNRDKDDFDKLDFSGKLGFKNNKWDIFALYKTTNQSADLDDGAFTDDDNHNLKFQRHILSYQAAYSLSNQLKLKFIGGYTDLIRTVTDDSSKTDSDGNYDHAFAKDTYKGNVINNEFQSNFVLNGANILLGLGRYEDKMSSDSYYLNTLWMLEIENNLDSLNLKSYTNTGFLHFDISGELFNERLNFLHLNIGGRYNRHSTFGNYFTYEVNPFLKIWNSVVIFGTFSTGFNTPSLYQLYSPSVNYISGIQRGNINLKPESSASVEFGFRYFSEKLKLNVSVYNTQIDNLNEYVYLWDKSIDIAELGNDWMRDDYRGDTYINIGKESITGIECGLQANLAKKLNVSANLSLLKGNITYSPDETSIYNDFHIQLFSTGDFLTETIDIKGLSRRSNTANLIIQYSIFNGFSISSDVQYRGGKNDVFYDPSLGPYGAMGKIIVNDYTLIGLNMNYKLKNRIIISLRTDNILNKKYTELVGYTTRGRGIYLKLRYQF